MKQRYIKVNRELIPVTEEIYHAANQMKEKERYRARRDGKCGQPDYRYCTGDCATCRWQQEGYRMLSISKVLGDNLEYEIPELTNSDPSFDGICCIWYFYPQKS